jgi:predicted O-methyltransferase YrrM
VTEGGRVANSARNALRPGYAQVMVRKLFGRLSPKERSGDEACAWARSVRISAGEVCRAIDEQLWQEALEFQATAKTRADAVSAELGHAIGYGVRTDLLYFVTRWHQPRIVVETGVAYGYSSFTVLSAMQRNGHGHLYSSDFPFFREHDPERLVGAMVPDHLRDEWTLLTQGDDANLPRILAAIGDAPIDLLHYDSDKSYAGRRRALALLEPHLAPDGVLLMDDIEDNTLFRDVVLGPPARAHLVIGHGTHYVGAIGLPAPA